MARRCNEFAAEMAARYSNRFGSFAVLPMPFTEDACREAAHALDQLGADGVVLLGSTDGIFLGDSRFDELMAELNGRRALVFVHPNLHDTSEAVELDMPGFLIEFLCDTTRAALNLVLSGTMERYPGAIFILPHAGGFLPYVAWRVSLANMMARYAKAAPQGVLTYIRRFYFDTALSPAPMPMAALKELVDPSHILSAATFPSRRRRSRARKSPPSRALPSGTPKPGWASIARMPWPFCPVIATLTRRCPRRPSLRVFRWETESAPR